MVYLNDIVTNFISKICDNKDFDDIKVLEAFPNHTMPSELKKVVLSVCLNNLDTQNYSLGESGRIGKYSISVNIFSPIKFGGFTPFNVFKRISAFLLSDSNIVSCKIEKLYADQNTECFVMKCLFEYEDRIIFGGKIDDWGKKQWEKWKRCGFNR